jgi:hypothetical protein
MLSAAESMKTGNTIVEVVAVFAILECENRMTRAPGDVR